MEGTPENTNVSLGMPGTAGGVTEAPLDSATPRAVRRQPVSRLRCVTPTERRSSPSEGAFAKAQPEITCRHQLSRFPQGGGEKPMTLAPDEL